jgi:chemotaxis signal transduction protein
MTEGEPTHILTCTCIGQLFGFDLSVVQEILTEQTMTRVPRAPDHFLGLINLRGDVVPVISLRRTLADQSKCAELYGHKHIILDLAGSVVSIVVDTVGDVIGINPSLRFPQLAGLDLPLKNLVSSIYSTSNQTILQLSPEALVSGSKQEYLR